MSPKKKSDTSQENLSDQEILSFQQQAEAIEAEKEAKRREREERKRQREQKKKAQVRERLVGPILLIITLILSAAVYFLSVMMSGS